MPSVNDNFADAIEVAIASAGGTYTSDLISNAGNTTETNEPTGTDARSMWFKYTPTSSGSATIDTQLSTVIASSTDTYMTVFTGTALVNLVSVATDDDGGGSGTSRIAGLSVTSGTTYWIQVGGYGNTELNVRLRVTGPETTGGGGTAYDKTPADAEGITDAATASRTTARIHADPIGLTDARTVVRTSERTRADAVGATDARTVVRTSSRTQADAVGLTDSVDAAFTGSATRTLADPVGLTDSVSVAVIANRSAADALGIVDTDSPILLEVDEAVADTTGITDAVAVVMARVFTVADVVGETDAAEHGASGDESATPTDDIGATDGTAWALDVIRAALDSAAITDTTTTTRTIARPVTDGAGLTDSVVAAMERIVILADLVGLADAAAHYRGLIVAPTERTIVTPAENRVEVIAAENRVTVTPAEDRMSGDVMAYVKDPNEVKDYGRDWAPHLLVAGADAGDTILTSTWSVPAGLTAGIEGTTDTTTTIWLSGGEAGNEYRITNHVVTAQGREFERSFTVNVQEM